MKPKTSGVGQHDSSAKHRLHSISTANRGHYREHGHFGEYNQQYEHKSKITIFRRDSLKNMTFVALLVVVAIQNVFALSHVHQHLVPINVRRSKYLSTLYITDFITNFDSNSFFIPLPKLGHFLLPW